MRNSNFDYCKKISDSSFRIVKPKELASMLNVSESTLRRMVKQNRVPAPRRTPKGYISGWSWFDISNWLIE